MSIKEDVRHLLEDTDHSAGKTFALAVQSLILISILTFSIDTLPDLSPNTRQLLDNIELITVLIFTIEYILRVICTKKSVQFIFSLYGLIDLAAILPFYLAIGLDLRGIRAVRMLRLARILKLAKYNRALVIFNRALTIVKEELMLFGFAALILLYLSATGIYYFEHAAQPDKFQSIFHSLWWALTTLTTVGYGDMYPVTIGGKVFTFIVLIIGLGVVAVPTGLIASAMSQARAQYIKNDD